jgi:Tol biopolymer transport system component
MEPFTATPTPQKQVLDYPSYGLRLVLPPGYQWAKQPVTGDLLLLVGIEQISNAVSSYDIAPIGLRVFTKPAGVKLVDWFNGKQGDCYEIGGQPAAGAYFIDPIVEDQADFQGMPALRVESRCAPSLYDIVIDRGSLVIDLYYLLDYPIDLQADFDQILASLEFYEPAVQIAETPVPTPTATVCLDEGAAPLAVPTRQSPLEVRFLSDGNIWAWEEEGSARQISHTGYAIRFTFSPDGEVIAFEQSVGDYPWGDYKIELWAINRNGEGLRRLVSTEQFDAFLPEHEDVWMANLPRDYRWLPDTQQLSFGVWSSIHALGGGDEARGYWVVDVDSLVLEKQANPEWVDLYGPKEIASPDGKIIASVDQTAISLLHADGSVIQSDVLTYTWNTCGEGPCWGAPAVIWTPDSRFLRTLVWNGDPFGDSFSTWEIPADGSPAQLLHTFSGMSYYSFISPNQEDIAYLRRARPESNDYELHLAKFDGSQDVIYTTGYYLNFQGWSPDSFHFVYGQTNLGFPFLGSLCGGAVPLVAPNETPASQITWVDASRFLFVSGGEGQPRELRLGQVGGASILIGPYNGDPYYDTAYYEIKPDQ